MKKTILFSLMLVLALGLFSCKGKEKEKSTSSEETTSQGSLEYDESYAYSGVKFEYNGLHYYIINHNSVYLVTHDSQRSITGDLVIPSKVRYNDATYYVVGIASHAFEDCTGMTSVTIPKSVQEIGRGAFRSCYSLSSITLPDGITNLDASAFDDTPFYNNEANWENGVLYIGNYLVATREMSHYSIKEGTKYIASYAFSDNNMLRSITIPNSVTSTGDGAFARCSGLTSISIPNSVTSIGGGAFAGCSGLTSITIPNSVKSIGEYAFYGCTGLTSVIIPNSVTSIGAFAFCGCTGLSSVTIPNSVTEIGYEAFAGCSALSSINIPKNVEFIGEGCFRGCEALTKVNYNGTQASWDQVVKNSDWMVGSSIELIHCRDVMIVMTEEIVQQTVQEEELPHEEDLILELIEEEMDIQQTFETPPPPPPPAPEIVQEVEVLNVVENDVETEVIEVKTEETNELPTIVPPPVEEEEEKEEEVEDVVFKVVETMPEFPGGQQAMMKFIAENIQYPVIAMEKGIQGRVICQFVVEKDGSISNIQVVRTSGNASLDKEGVRVISTMPKWKPGTQRGKPVRVTYTIPVNFRLG